MAPAMNRRATSVIIHAITAANMAINRFGIHA